MPVQPPGGGGEAFQSGTGSLLTGTTEYQVSTGLLIHTSPYPMTVCVTRAGSAPLEIGQGEGAE